jgi:SAM-dependent methyltransferase
MLRIARRRVPGVPLHRGDMRSFDLAERFDVVSCLFSAIGYLQTEADVRRAFRTFAGHLRPGGVVLVEPWISPEMYLGRHVTVVMNRDEDSFVVRTSESRREPPFAVVTFDYLIGEERRGVRHIREEEWLRMTPYPRLLELLGSAGLRARWVQKGTGAVGGRGCLVGIAPGGR